jgi:hypothetical protein
LTADFPFYEDRKQDHMVQGSLSANVCFRQISLGKLLAASRRLLSRFMMSGLHRPVGTAAFDASVLMLFAQRQSYTIG